MTRPRIVIECQPFSDVWATEDELAQLSDAQLVELAREDLLSLLEGADFKVVRAGGGGDTTAPCPDGDACPDARRWGDVHRKDATASAPQHFSDVANGRDGGDQPNYYEGQVWKRDSPASACPKCKGIGTVFIHGRPLTVSPWCQCPRCYGTGREGKP